MIRKGSHRLSLFDRKLNLMVTFILDKKILNSKSIRKICFEFVNWIRDTKISIDAHIWFGIIDLVILVTSYFRIWKTNCWNKVSTLTLSGGPAKAFWPKNPIRGKQDYWKDCIFFVVITNFIFMQSLRNSDSMRVKWVSNFFNWYTSISLKAYFGWSF